MLGDLLWLAPVDAGIDIGGIASQFAMPFCPGATQLFLRVARTAKHFLRRFSRKCTVLVCTNVQSSGGSA